MKRKKETTVTMSEPEPDQAPEPTQNPAILSDAKFADPIEEIACRIQAHTPLIWVTTYEEERFIRDLHKRVARKQRLALFHWSQVQGLVAHDPKEITLPPTVANETKKPSGLLDFISSFSLEQAQPTATPTELPLQGSIFVLRDFNHNLLHPVPRHIRDIIHSIANEQKVIIILSPSLSHAGKSGMEATLEKDTTVIPYDLPDRETIEQIVRGILQYMKERAKGQQTKKLDYTEEELFAISRALQGLTQSEIENAFAASMARLKRLDLEMLADEKKQLVRKSDILEYVEARITTSDIGGLDQAKEFFTTYTSSFSPAATTFGVEPLKGVLLVGVPGAGKSLLAKAISSLWQVPAVRLDIGKVMAGVVGGSVRGSEEIIWFELGGRAHRNTIKELVDLKPKDCWVDTYNDEGKHCLAKVEAFIAHKLDQSDKLYRLHLEDGRSIVTTGDHGVLGYDEGLRLVERRVDSLEPGDHLAMPGEFSCRPDAELPGTWEQGFLAGAWLGDGDYNDSYLRLHVNEKDTESYAPILDHGGYRYMTYDSSSSEHAKVLHIPGVRVQMEEVGFIGNCHTKRVPESVFGYSNTYIRGLLSGYFAADGSFTDHVLEASSVSRELRDDIARLLHLVGIKACVAEKTSCSGFRVVPGVDYVVRISGEADLYRFEQRVGFPQDYKAEALASRKPVNAHGYYVPLTEQIKEETHTARRAMWASLHSRPYNFDYGADAIGLATLQKISQFLPAPTEGVTMGRAQSQEVRWVRVSHLEEVPRLPGEELVYDLSVPTTGKEKFIVGSCPLLVHNSEERMRQAIRSAESLQPCILWLDEVEKALSGTKSSNYSDAGTLSRVFGTLLTAMQEGLEGVTIIATANDITSLPPEFIRRFDEVFFVDLPTPSEREEIFRIHLLRRGRNPSEIDLSAAVPATHMFTGAEIEKVVKSAIARCFYTGARQVTPEDLVTAARATKPLAVLMGDKITQIREWARDRARFASSGAEVLARPGNQRVTTRSGQELKLDDALGDLGEETAARLKIKQGAAAASNTGNSEDRFSNIE